MQKPEVNIALIKENRIQQTKLKKDERMNVKKSNNEEPKKISMHYIKELLKLKDDFPNK